MLKKIVFLLFCCSCISTKEIPSYVHLCRRDDPGIGDCFQKTVYEIMPHLIKGIPEMDIPPLDPIGFTSIHADTGNGGSVSMVVELVNGTASGIKDVKLENFLIDFDKLRFSCDIELPHVEISAFYKVRGKILLFEVNGGGHSSFNATDVKTKVKWSASTYKKKNKTHMKMDKIELNEVKIDNIQVKLSNLFGENNALTENVNVAINENIPSLREELEPLIKDTLGKIILDYFNRVYTLFPMDQLYPIA